MNRPAVRRLLLAVVLVLGLALALWSLAGRLDEVGEAASELSWPFVTAAVAVSLASLVLSLLTWRATLAALGQPLPLAPAARIYFLGQIGKYLPGSLWPVLAQMELAAARGLPRPVVGTASLLALALGVPGALLLGLLAVPALLTAGKGGYTVVFAALPLALLALWPPVLERLLDRGLRLVGRPPPVPLRLTGAAVARVALLSGFANVLLGLQAALLAYDLGAAGWQVVPAAIGAFTLANVAGLLALPLPAGAGVREVVLIAALSPVLPLPVAVVLAVVSRAVLTLADLAVAGAAAIAARKFVAP